MTSWDDAAQLIRDGKVGVLPTDTVYGLVCSALQPEAVEQLYDLKYRQPDKPPVIIISHENDLKALSINITPSMREQFKQWWPGPVSLILPCRDEKIDYLHRGKDSLAVRLSSNETLRSFVQMTGPLATSSANIEGQPPATTIAQAQTYFHDDVDFYVDGGELPSQPSKIISLLDEEPVVIRP